MIRRPPRSTLFPYTTPSDLERIGQRVEEGGVVAEHLGLAGEEGGDVALRHVVEQREHLVAHPVAAEGRVGVDRKSTRLNSSHANISYAVFCLKKKKNNKTHT